MSSEISPKADVSPKAKIGDGCKIFPFVYIEDDVVIGDNCVIFPFVSILMVAELEPETKFISALLLVHCHKILISLAKKANVLLAITILLEKNVVNKPLLHIEVVAPLLGQTTFLWKVYTLAMTPKWATTAYLAMKPKLQAIARLPTTQSSRQASFKKQIHVWELLPI